MEKPYIESPTWVLINDVLSQNGYDNLKELPEKLKVLLFNVFNKGAEFGLQYGILIREMENKRYNSEDYGAEDDEIAYKIVEQLVDAGDNDLLIEVAKYLGIGYGYEDRYNDMDILFDEVEKTIKNTPTKYLYQLDEALMEDMNAESFDADFTVAMDTTSQAGFRISMPEIEESNMTDDELKDYALQQVREGYGPDYWIEGERDMNTLRITEMTRAFPYEPDEKDAESFEAPKGQLFTPYKNTTSGETINMRINSTDMRNFDNLPNRSRRTVLITNMKDGKRYYVRRADCGAGCYCAAEVVKVKEAESFDAERKNLDGTIVFTDKDFYGRGPRPLDAKMKLFGYGNDILERVSWMRNKNGKIKGAKFKVWKKNAFEAESFDSPKSPALKNLSTIAVLALAIFAGKKLKE